MSDPNKMTNIASPRIISSNRRNWAKCNDKLYEIKVKNFYYDGLWYRIRKSSAKRTTYEKKQEKGKKTDVVHMRTVLPFYDEWTLEDVSEYTSDEEIRSKRNNN